MYSDNIEYAANRLEGTIVMLEGEPIRVDSVLDCGTVEFRYLNSGLSGECDLDDLDLVGQNNLGYVNINNTAAHLVRVPMREDWRQGIRMANLSFSGDEGFHDLPWKELRETILGIFPSFTKAKHMVTEEGYDKVAFSRHFAVDSDSNILYKERVVGKFGFMVELADKFRYLYEHLNSVVEVHNEVN